MKTFSVFTLPLGDGVEHELDEGERARVFTVEAVDDVGVVLQYVETVADIAAVEVATDGMRDVVEGVGGGILVGEIGGLETVHGTPGKIDVVGARFLNGVLEIKIMVEDAAVGVCEVGELFDAREKPRVEFREIVFA